MTILLTGTESAKGIIAVRAIGKEGVNVTTSSHKSSTAASFSKYSKGYFRYADPVVDEIAFINSLTHFLKHNKHDVLIPLHSRETYIISKYKNVLEKYVSIPVADYNKISLANDKNKILHLAEKLGLKIPKTFEINDVGQIQNLDIVFPAVIKLLDRSSGAGLSYVYGMEELLEKYEATVKNFNLEVDNYPIIQEYIDGSGLGTSVLYNNGQMVAFLSHLRLRENPPSGGPSTYRTSVRNIEAEKMSKRLLDHLNWHGVAMLEFKIEKSTNKPYLIEVNPRFWGSMYQSIASGVNFPYWLYLVSQGKKLNFEKKINLGVKTRFLALDLLAFFKYFKTSKNKTDLFKSYVSVKGIRFDLESFDDFSPTFNYYIENFRGR